MGIAGMVQLRSHPRLVRKLQEALRDELCIALDDASVVEIMLNPDGRLFIERLGHGIAAAGEMTAVAAEIVIGSVAHALQSQADDEQPIISGELPIGGHRFEGLLPPVVSRPTFSIRRRASRLIPLDAYVKSKVMTKNQADVIRNAIASRLNIVISGGTGSGKTTLANAVISEIVEAAPDDRIVILEDTAEIRCAAENTVALHTSDTIDMARLLKTTMRLRPDRIIVGEVIGEAVDLIVSIERSGQGRRVRDVIHVESFNGSRYETESYSQIDEDSYAA
jgi:type IV secretion system protein VirB11